MGDCGSANGGGAGSVVMYVGAIRGYRGNDGHWPNDPDDNDDDNADDGDDNADGDDDHGRGHWAGDGQRPLHRRNGREAPIWWDNHHEAVE